MGFSSGLWSNRHYNKLVTTKHALSSIATGGDLTLGGGEFGGDEFVVVANLPNRRNSIENTTRGQWRFEVRKVYRLKRRNADLTNHYRLPLP